MTNTRSVENVGFSDFHSFHCLYWIINLEVFLKVWLNKKLKMSVFYCCTKNDFWSGQLASVRGNEFFIHLSPRILLHNHYRGFTQSKQTKICDNVVTGPNKALRFCCMCCFFKFGCFTSMAENSFFFTAIMT